MPTRPSDRNLLFGVLALHMDLIERAVLVDALREWLADKQRSLGEILVAQGKLSADDRQRIEQMVDRRVADCGGSLERGLETVSSLGSVREELAGLGDAELQTSLQRIAHSDVTSDSADRAFHAAGTSPGSGARFRILKMQDKGGMGVVWMAEDAELPRQVAVKEIKAEFARDLGTRQRFQLEAEITGGLEHPGIVPVYGLGTFNDGRPFYVMRFIRGDSLKNAIERFHQADKNPARDPTERSLALRDLLQRFLDVCDAIAYAHQRGILHRDLKPGNVMVGRFGETLVVDWGLAKVIDRQDEPRDGDEALNPPSASSSEPTLRGPVGTLQFMSPEQALDQHQLLGKASDVYGLGATLYALLTGLPPRTSTDRVELLAQAQQGIFTPVRAANPRVPPALAMICQQSLSPDPNRRYASAEALADDVKHWLADEPVSVWREPAATRLARWARRHRTLVAGLATALLVAVALLSTGLVVLGRKNDELRLARDSAQRSAVAAQESAALAERRFRESKQLIDDWFTGVSESRELKNAAGLQPLRKKLLQRAKDYYQQALQESGSNPELRADTAAAASRIGKIVGEIGSKQDAIQAYRQAIDLREKLTQQSPGDAVLALELARSRHELGRLLYENRSLDEALQQFESARAIRQRLVDEHPQEANYRNDLAGSHNAVGMLLAAVGRIAEAQPEYQRCLELREQAVREQPDDHQAARDLAFIHQHLAVFLAQSGKALESLPHFTEANHLLERASKARLDDAALAAELANAHHNFALFQSMLGRRSEAVEGYRRARDIQARLVRENPAVDAYAFQLSMTHANLGIVLADMEESEQALESYLESAAVRERLVREHPTVTNYALTLANSYDLLAVHYSAADRPDDALSILDKAIVHAEKLAADQPQLSEARNVVGSLRLNRGAALSKLNRTDEALNDCVASIAVYNQLAEENSQNPEFASGQAKACSNAGSLLLDMGRTGEAQQQFQSAKGIRQRLADENPEQPEYRSDLATTLDDLGFCLSLSGQFEEATSQHRQAEAVHRKLVEQDPESTAHRLGLARSLHDLGMALSRGGQVEPALAACREALTIRQELAKGSPETAQFRIDLAQSHNTLGELLLSLGRAKEADPEFRVALELREQIGAASPEDLGLVQLRAQSEADLARLALATNAPDAQGWLDRAQDSYVKSAPLSAESWFDLACVCCLQASKAPAGEEGRTESASRLDQALDALRKAVANGLADRQRFETTPDLEPLRERAEFRSLLETMGARAPR